MTAKLKSFLIVSLKQAVNALLTNATMTTLFPQFMGWHTADWWVNVGKVALATVVSREALVWGPKILAWSQSNGGEDN